MIETERLILRRWRDADRAPFAEMSADPAVMDTLGGTLLSRAQADAYIDQNQARFEEIGVGRWAVERREDGVFIGAVGLAPIHQSLPMPEGFEMGWRLAHHAWGFGFASEAARAAIRDGFERAGLAVLYAFTSAPNRRSQAVMDRAGLVRAVELDFDHPALAADHPQRRHLVWKGVATAAGSGRS